MGAFDDEAPLPPTESECLQRKSTSKIRKLIVNAKTTNPKHKKPLRMQWLLKITYEQGFHRIV